MSGGDAVTEVVAGTDFGKASARKSGRDPRWPFVPIIDWSERLEREGGFQRTEQVLGLAYETRAEAVAAAQAMIDKRRAAMDADLRDPRKWALREWHGLPRDLPCGEA